MRSLKDNIHGVVDLGVVLMIGVAFAGLAVLAYIIFTLKDLLTPDPSGTGADANTWASYNQSNNITAGFDNAVTLILVAITIFILAIAISALLMLRGRQ